MPFHRRPRPGLRRDARGLGLVELLVAIAISLVLVLAATAVFVGSRSTQRSVDGASAAQEAGAFAMRLIGRDLMNAGFWPTVQVEDPNLRNVVPSYINVTTPLRPAYDFGLFGCEGAVFDVATGTCPAAVSGAPDSIVVAYFTSDAFGTNIGQRGDCQGNDVDVADLNKARRGTGPTDEAPARPLFVANHYTLVGGPDARAGVTESVTDDGQPRVVTSLGCNGIGSGARWDQTRWQAIVPGLDDLQFTYGVIAASAAAAGGANVDSRTPDRFYTATEVNALPAVDIDGRTLPAWARVTAVRVCIVARSVEPNTAMGNASTAPRTFRNCNGQDVALAATDRDVRRTFVQVFGVRNRQTLTY